ncbi:MAG TPA: OmpA family protein [Pirellulales bacterium]|jgi:flagellar motor protein MotB|nr:OmpA family protein [Pirellulales bacterium]
MRWIAGVTILAAGSLALTGGCAQNPFAAKEKANQQQQQQTAIATQQNSELLNRVAKTDRDNQEIQAQLAQAQQQVKLSDDQNAALREQLNNATNQLAQLRDDKSLTEQRAQAITASVKRPSGAILPNSSLRQNVSQLNLPGLEVRQDGDVVRIELPSEKLFDPGTARLRNGANLIIENAALEIARVYPNQVIGIEGHTDADPLQGSTWITNHQLSLAQASAVFEFISTRLRFRPEQLFVAGHGGNNPVVSNATLVGKARNRRVELVIYPEQPNR